MIRSMTGFASESGHSAPFSWTWELRGVNGKGQDLRLRVPDWIDGLEVALRGYLAKNTSRGNITLALRVAKEDAGGTHSINDAHLDSVLEAMARIEARAMDMGVSLAPSTSSDILSTRGVFEQVAGQDDTSALSKAILSAFPDLVAAFNDMRDREGAALETVLLSQLEQIETLTGQAAEQAQARKADMADALRQSLARVLDNSDGADPDRVAQELALIAVKTDVTEEIDRLGAHVVAARDLIASGGPVGRKLDFLMQEFNREANTLCSKAQNTELTSTGLALKAVIDQMREQVQNVE